ncbi:PAS domain S-box-containing protein [Lysobacter niabensis]|uniref:histidine kinase n=1 Tax=Agrilutibacter niabensis TaxID=380628 RepID=A0ABU1VRW0_9GAMM|nr:PAS domain S-box protein [Lysobacter niabensis]MDR7100219.1 PAS domain S-box-containing protein [Lysobacter niabensis]
MTSVDTTWGAGISDATYRLLVESMPEYAILLLDADGHIRSWNKGAQRIKGYRAEEVIGRHFSMFYPRETVEQGWPEYELGVARATGRFEDEGWRVRKDGSRFWANVILTRIDNPDGSLRGFAKVTRDLSERREQEERLRRSEERFRLLVDGVRDYAIFMLDTTGRISSWNPGAQEIKGYTADEIIGRHFSTFYTEEALARGWPARELEIALAEGRVEDEGWRVRKDGTRFWASVVITALHDSEGRHVGFAKITRDLTAHRRVRALEDEGHRLTTFLAMLGHELRNPLAPITNAVALMRAEPIASESLRYCRDVIGRQVAQMTRLVDDLLDVSRITSGKVRINPQVLDLRPVLAEAVETVETEARQRAHALQVEVTEAPAWVVGDRARLVQVLSNLLNNAVKFTPPGGNIHARLRIVGDHVEVVVRDNGPGIAPEKLVDIFNPFVQGEQDEGHSQGGLGLGLSLVQQLVGLHGGEVSASSSGQPGEGAEFLIRLPATIAPATATAAEPPAAPAAPRRVLVVDDNRDAGDTLQAMLQFAGYDSQTVYDGASALQAVRDSRFDAVILDIGLPDVSGLEVARRLRASPSPPPPLIALTGYGQDIDLAATREAGFHAHLTKPLMADKIMLVLSQLFDDAA